MAKSSDHVGTCLRHVCSQPPAMHRMAKSSDHVGTCLRHVCSQPPAMRSMAKNESNMPKACPYNKNIFYTMEQYRKTPRAHFLNYDNGDYFITICTKDKKHFFGKIINNEMQYTPIGLFCHKQLENVSSFTNTVRIIVFTVMPNHVHVIIRVVGTEGEEVDTFQRSLNPSLRANSTDARHIPILSRYISSFKGAVTKYAKSLGLEFGWQPRYYDHYIRNLQDGDNIYEYIVNNVFNWHKDCFR